VLRKDDSEWVKKRPMDFVVKGVRPRGSPDKELEHGREI